MLDTLFDALGRISGILSGLVLVAFGLLLLSPRTVRSHRLIRRFVEYVGNVEIGNSSRSLAEGIKTRTVE